MRILIDIATQRLTLYKEKEIVRSYPCSTSRYGIGNLSGSNKTPLGLHTIVEKYGDNVPLGGIFSSREFTGEIASINETQLPSAEDHITSRILRLAGLQEGVNKGGLVDSYGRYIYIHGTPDEGLIGSPASHGCIRLKNADVIELYEYVPLGTEVEII